jgi:hypothetical protein
MFPNRAQRDAAELAHALGEFVGGGKDLFGLLVEEQVVIRGSGGR